MGLALAASPTGHDQTKNTHSHEKGGSRLRDAIDSERAEVRRDRIEVVDAEDIRGTAHNGPAVGEIAPDFSLTPLIKDEDITEENVDAQHKPVRLSDFKGKKPVALIFGSYT